jgi:prefoldin subunit 5
MTEEQKRKFTERRLDRAIEIIEMKISDTEKRIAVAKGAIADIRKDKELIR